MEVEALGGDCCDEAVQSAARDEANRIDRCPDSAPDHCGDCIDIPLLASGRIAIEAISMKRMASSTPLVNWESSASGFLPLALRTEQRTAVGLPRAFSAPLPLLL